MTNRLRLATRIVLAAALLIPFSARCATDVSPEQRTLEKIASMKTITPVTVMMPFLSRTRRYVTCWLFH